SLLFFSYSSPHPNLPSFPTRRSSDLRFSHYGRQRNREYRNYLDIVKLFLRTHCIFQKLATRQTDCLSTIKENLLHSVPTIQQRNVPSNQKVLGESSLDDVFGCQLRYIPIQN